MSIFLYFKYSLKKFVRVFFLIFISLISFIKIYSFGNPADYNLKGKASFPKKYKAAVSTLHNNTSLKENEFYSSALSSLMLNFLENINWTYREGTQADEFYYGQNKKELKNLKAENQNPELLIQNRMQEEKSKIKNSEIKGIAGLDPNFISLEWEEDLNNTNFKADTKKEIIRNYCIRNNLNFFIYGSYSLLSAKQLEVQLSFFSLIHDNIKKYSFFLPVKNYSSRLEQNLYPLEEDISGKKMLPFSLVTNPEACLLYIDGKYFGQTPVRNKRISRGIHIFTLEKNGYFSKRYKVNIFKKADFSAKLKEKKKPGVLQVLSNPPGAGVYIGAAFAGLTPLLLKDIPEGNHRIRIHYDEYIDKFRTINIRKSKTKYVFNINLEKGDTAAFYNVNKKILWNFSYYDLSIGSFGGFTLSLLGALYFDIQRSNTYDQLRKEVPTDKKNFTKKDYQTKKIYEDRMDSYRTYSAAMQISAGAFLGLSLYFFIQYIKLGNLDIAGKEKPDNNYLASNVSFTYNLLNRNYYQKNNSSFEFKVKYSF